MNTNCNSGNQPIWVSNCSTCGLLMTLQSDRCCCRVCEQVNYTLTIQYNCSSSITDCVVSLPIDNSLCLMRGSLMVNGNVVNSQCGGTNNICLGTINQNETVTITFTCTVMNLCRYIRMRATCNFCVCAFCMKQPMAVSSNMETIQVCGCCN